MEYTNLYPLILVPLVFLLVSRRLIYGIYILIVLLPFERFFVTRTLGVNIKLAEWMGVVCVLGFVWNFLIKPRRKMFSSSILLPLFAFVVVNIALLMINLPKLIGAGSLSDLNSPGVRSIKVVSWCIYSILIALAVSYSIKDKRDLKNCITALLGITLAICTISLISMILNMLGILFATWTLITRAGIIGIKGSFSEPAYFANYMSAIVPLALLIFILRAYRLGLFFTVSASFILLLVNYFSFSTAGLAGMTLMLFLIPYFIRHYRLVTTSKAMRYTLILFLCIYIVFLVGVLFNVDFAKVTVANYFEKLSMKGGRWAARIMAFNMFQDHPIIGLGPGNWAWYQEQGYAQQVMKETFVKPSYNCLYWEILVDLGLVGSIPFVWFFVSLFRQLSKAVWKAKDMFLKAVLVGFIVGFIVLLSEYYVGFNFYRIHVWAILGIAMAAIRLSKEEETAG